MKYEAITAGELCSITQLQQDLLLKQERKPNESEFQAFKKNTLKA